MQNFQTFISNGVAKMKKCLFVITIFSFPATGVKSLKRFAGDQGRSQGGKGGTPPPETEKIVVENGVISESSIFRIFIKKFQNFLKISKFSQNFPTIWVFRPNAQKINAWFVKYF